MFGFFRSKNGTSPTGGVHAIPSELRQDVVTGDWIVIARSRSKRPSDFSVPATQAARGGKDPFADPKASGNADPVARYDDEKGDWLLQVIPNKFPAFTQRGECMVPRAEGPFEVVDGRGYHEVVITKDPVRDFAQFSSTEAALVIRAFHERFLALRQDACVRYISIFQNHGVEAGASLSHPHSQIIAIPVVPADVRRSLGGAKRWHKKNGTNVHEEVLAWERQRGERMLFENKDFVVVCPFVSRVAFEMRIFPKTHQSSFGDIAPSEYETLGNALRAALAMLRDTLNDPPYNFFIHTTPVNGKDSYEYYQWHIEILPKTATWAGFELGTGIEISTLEPERAAAFLREHLPSWARLVGAEK